MKREESNGNRLIKGLWSLTKLKSSDYIKIAKETHLDLTGSRLRGLMSSVANKNYRKATEQDVFQCIVMLSAWAGIHQFVNDIDSKRIDYLLYEVDRLKATGEYEALSGKQCIRKVLMLQIAPDS